MQIKTLLRLLGLLLMVFSLSMLTPLLVNAWFNEPFWQPFLIAFSTTFVCGLLLWMIFHRHQQELKIRDGFLFVILFWFILCFFASFPFILTLENHSFTDALFESVSGFTTTGASIIRHIDDLPHAILFYRQQLQFFGGMGIIVLAVAILPMLGVGGMQLYRAETPGPLKDSKLTPRIAKTAKALWIIYFLLTFCCLIAYYLAGMDWFEALGESFATVSTGGFSMHDQSFAFYQSDAIEFIACVFMLLGGTNFALHFLVFKTFRIKLYWQDEEFRSYLLFILLASSLILLSLIYYGFFKAHPHAVVKCLFQVVSLATTTGFLSETFANWPSFIPILLLFLAIIGGCAASTSGGIKVLRALLLFKQSRREIQRMLHPQAIIPIKFGQQALAEPVLQGMWAFISAFVALYIVIMLLLMGFGNDFITAFSAMTATLANAGVGIGQIQTTFANLNAPSKWLLMFAMIAGRLEIFSLLVLLSPQFWRK